MNELTIANDPILNALFKNILTKPPEDIIYKKSTVEFTHKSAIMFLKNLGVSDSNIKIVTKDLFKDIKFMQSLESKIRRSKKEKKFQMLSVYFLSKLQIQTADLIVEKILGSSFGDTEILYAKLHLLRKFKETCKYIEVYNVIIQSFKNYKHKALKEKLNEQKHEKNINKNKHNQNVIYFSDYFLNSKN